MYSDIRIRQIYHPYVIWPTTFYPRYTSGYDYVSYVSPVERVTFQKVLPRYLLSSSQTRDSGLGPFFENITRRARSDEEEGETLVGKPPGGKRQTPLRHGFVGCLTGWHVDVLV